MADHIKTIGEETSKLCRLPDGRGRFWHFEKASIYWTAETGAHAVYEPFRAHWKNAGWEKGWLGYPQSSTIRTYYNRGWTTNFQVGN
ncbi:MAG: LGFP repeat-containing protein [Parvularculaceae bacterium]